MSSFMSTLPRGKVSTRTCCGRVCPSACAGSAARLQGVVVCIK